MPGNLRPSQWFCPWPHSPPCAASKLDLCTAALELLQWKDNLQQPLALVAPLQATLAALLGWQGGAGAGGAAGAGYATQLTLSALLALAQRAQQAQQGEALAAFDLGLAVRAAQAAPDGTLRNAALSLVGALAAADPQVGGAGRRWGTGDVGEF